MTLGRRRHPLQPEKVEQARAAALLTEQAARELAAAFGLLADPLRLRIAVALATVDELCVTDLALATAVVENRVSQALRHLRQAGVVENRRAGREVFYRLADDRVRRLLGASGQTGDPGGESTTPSS